ncbi:MAG: hypothetical protein EON93_05790 [Burkholderiales bacterium]|nr:MAG: hypothetical protein EON93_05790 [Burkholderiales bacterium]
MNIYDPEKKLAELLEITTFAEDVNNKLDRLRTSNLILLLGQGASLVLAMVSATALTYFLQTSSVRSLDLIPSIVSGLIAILGVVGYLYAAFRIWKVRRDLRIESEIMTRLISMIYGLHSSLGPNMDSVTRAVMDMRLSRLEFSRRAQDFGLGQTKSP